MITNTKSIKILKSLYKENFTLDLSGFYSILHGLAKISTKDNYKDIARFSSLINLPNKYDKSINTFFYKSKYNKSLIKNKIPSNFELSTDIDGNYPFADFVLESKNHIFSEWARKMTPIRREIIFHGKYQDFPTSFMESSSNDIFRVFSSDMLDIVEIPFKNQDNLYLFKPKTTDVAFLMQNLEVFLPLINEVQSDCYCTVQIPIFENKNVVDFIPFLKENGVNSIFQFSSDWNFIDWEEFPSDQYIAINEFKQKNHIIFDINGAKIDTITYAAMISGCCFDPKVFCFNSPFLYVISNENGIKLIGTMEDF